MPVISMFYGIIIRMYVLDTQNHNRPTCTQGMPSSKPRLALAMPKCLRGNCLENNCGLCKHGSSCTATS